MLRNQHKSERLLKHIFPLMQQRQLKQQTVLYNKNTNVFREGKIMGKLFGQRVSGSKKRWFPSTTGSTPAYSPHILFKQSQFGKAPSGGDKNSARRVTVLNKLFMKHITDLMATGEISESILGKGLQISRVKISQDFAYVNVFWLVSCEMEKDVMLEQELQRCSGLLRHELSQLGLMGVVPRIKFVKDKLYSNMYQVENLLSKMDFGPDDEEQQVEIDLHKADIFKQDFYGSKTNDLTQQDFKNIESIEASNESTKTIEFVIPEMRHDVLGLDHKGIMLKILTKMKKSKQAWDQYIQNTSARMESENSVENSSTIPSASYSNFSKINEKLAKAAANSEKFEAFLAKRRERRDTPERKKFRISDHHLDDVNKVEEHDYSAQVMSTLQRQIFEAEDYIYDDLDDRKQK